MRTPVASLSKKILSTVFATTLVVGLMPAAAFAAEDGDTAVTIPAGEMINQVEPLEVVAQQESTKSYFLARTLEDTHTVPMVSANLPLDTGMADDVVTSDEGAADADIQKPEQESAVAIESVVVGSFEQDGIVYAIEPSGGSVAVVAVDYSKLPEAYVEAQVIVIPESVTPDDIDYFSVTRIANNAFASLKNANANPDYVGCETLLSDEGLLAEAGIESIDLVEDDPLVGCAGILALSVPAGITVIDDGAFAGFETLQYIVVSEDNPEYASYDGALYSADLTNLRLIPEGRVGAVCVASSAVEVDSEVFSHCPLAEPSIADADDAAIQLAPVSASVTGRLLKKAVENEAFARSLVNSELLASSGLPMMMESTSFYSPGQYMVNYKYSGSTKLEYVKRVFTNGTYAQSTVSTETITGNKTFNAGSIYSNVSNVFMGVEYTTENGKDTRYYYRVTPSRSGYKCSGWSFGGTAYTASGDLPRKSGTLEPNWTGNTYTITWNSQGGSTVKSTTFTYSDTGKVALPTAPTRPGYTFRGWYTAMVAGTKVTSSTALPKANTTYYAQWVQEKTPLRATFHSGNSPMYRWIYSHSHATTDTTTGKMGAPYGPVAAYASAVRLTSENVEYRGNYLPSNNDVTYHVGLTDLGTTSVGGVSNAWLVTTDANGLKTGQTIESEWISVADSAGVHVYLNGLDNFDVVFDPNGGTCDTPILQDNKPYDRSVVFPEAKREGYTFKGWYTAANGGSKVTNPQDTAATYYAQWQKDTPDGYFYSDTGRIVRSYQNISDSIGSSQISLDELDLEIGEAYCPTNPLLTLRLTSGAVEAIGPNRNNFTNWRYLVGIDLVAAETIGGVKSAWAIGIDANGVKTAWALGSSESDVTIYDQVDIYLNDYGSFSVSFDSNGGNEGVQTVEGVMPYGPWTAPSATRSGYVITGWYDGPGEDANYVCAANGAGPAVEEVTTLFAHWAIVSAAVVPLNVTAKVDMLGIADQEAVLDADGYQGYIESRSAGALKVAKVDFTPFSGADELFGTSKSRVLLEALAQGSSSADYSFALDAADSEDDVTKLAPFSLDAGVGTKKHITYRFDIPDDVLASIDRGAFTNKTTSIGRVSYTVAVDEWS